MIKNTHRPNLIVIVRHAESARNVVLKNSRYLPADENADVVRGVPDHKVPITEKGKKQALATGKAIKKKFGLFDVVYDSGYLRTQQTREGILKAYTKSELSKMKLRSSHLIRERDPGYAFNLNTEEVEKYFPYLKEYWKIFGQFYSRPPGGKSQADVCDQIYNFIGTLFSQRVGKKILIITHGGTLRAFRFNLEKWTAEDYEKNYSPTPKNCGVTTYRYSEKTGRLELEENNKVYWTEEDVK